MHRPESSCSAVHHTSDIPDTASISEKNIAEAYKIIYKYLETKLSNEKIFDAFRMYLYKKVIVIKIDVDEPKDVAMAFEVINDRGIPLKAYVRRILERQKSY